MGVYEYVCAECGARRLRPSAYLRRGREFCSQGCRDLYLKEGPAMPGEELEEILNYLDIPPQWLAKHIGVDLDTFQGMRSGHVRIDRRVAGKSRKTPWHPKAFRSRRKGLGVSQTQLARMFGLRGVQDYEEARTGLPRHIMVAMIRAATDPANAQHHLRQADAPAHKWQNSGRYSDR